MKKVKKNTHTHTNNTSNKHCQRNKFAYGHTWSFFETCLMYGLHRNHFADSLLFIFIVLPVRSFMLSSCRTFQHTNSSRTGNTGIWRRFIHINSFDGENEQLLHFCHSHSFVNYFASSYLFIFFTFLSLFPCHSFFRWTCTDSVFLISFQFE